MTFLYLTGIAQPGLAACAAAGAAAETARAQAAAAPTRLAVSLITAPIVPSVRRSVNAIGRTSRIPQEKQSGRWGRPLREGVGEVGAPVIDGARPAPIPRTR